MSVAVTRERIDRNTDWRDRSSSSSSIGFDNRSLSAMDPTFVQVGRESASPSMSRSRKTEPPRYTI